MCLLWPVVSCRQLYICLLWPVVSCRQLVICLLWPVVSCRQLVICLLWPVVSCRQLDICLLQPVVYHGQWSLLDTVTSFTPVLQNLLNVHFALFQNIALTTRQNSGWRHKGAKQTKKRHPWHSQCHLHGDDSAVVTSVTSQNSSHDVKCVTIIISLWQSMSVVMHVWQCLLHLRGRLVMWCDVNILCRVKIHLAGKRYYSETEIKYFHSISDTDILRSALVATKMLSLIFLQNILHFILY